jgi:hypothetical protein
MSWNYEFAIGCRMADSLTKLNKKKLSFIDNGIPHLGVIVNVPIQLHYTNLFLYDDDNTPTPIEFVCDENYKFYNFQTIRSKRLIPPTKMFDNPFTQSVEKI